ncbi:helix-turn-helix domain-containing protein [Solibaculum intestinale]|uniref:Helix-turn-helix transcriptional regulator n=1 Tax=Solibaculum intestinale TaxID=3133165 RepID=A0ABV1DXM7_9FIRM
MENYRLIIRKKRKQLGLSQNQLARAVGISQPFMNEIELGKKSPSVEVLIKICEALDIPFLGQEKEDL